MACREYNFLSNQLFIDMINNVDFALHCMFLLCLFLLSSSLVCSNQIQTLPLSLVQCVNLERLHLGANKIEYLPPEIFSALVKLKELYVYKNKIQNIPPEIGNLQCKLLSHDVLFVCSFVVGQRHCGLLPDKYYEFACLHALLFIGTSSDYLDAMLSQCNIDMLHIKHCLDGAC